MTSFPDEPPLRDKTTPFLLKIFYRTGAFHRPDEFLSSDSLPLSTDVYAWRNTTLEELTLDLLLVKPAILPKPAIGTRLVFRLIWADNTQQALRFSTKDIGSVVIGAGRPGASRDEGWDDVYDNNTLGEAKFVIGDYISCAILPPDEMTGEVLPTSAARMGRGSGIGEGRASAGVGGARPPAVGPRRDLGSDRHRSGNRYDGRGNGRMPSGGSGWPRVDPYPRGGRSDYGGGADREPGMRYRERGSRREFPDGEWRRGERLPEPPMGSGRGPR
ncbi:Sin3 associated polypeptide p18-domain-containing protein [Apodospora peruviana]|uniref:Sin3 associated polypeptide p18-domain-containing protein n=1 Tax=Apodospora peruviana TaxID=516989 RepID=A0AAE0M009_9PEZI|nr:Sin3 associated polypeptide p18-domain-containing protein [Apodospora peruviana]